MREERARGTELGRAMEEWTREGRLFPDEVALTVLKAWLDQGRWETFVLDGFPRTVGQARAFERELTAHGQRLDLAILLTLSDEEIRGRILNRVTCVKCGATYGMTFHNVMPGDPCEDCGAKLERRSDDTLATLDARLAEHRRHTDPVVDFYRAAGLLFEIDAAAGRESVAKRIGEVMNAEGIS